MKKVLLALVGLGCVIGIGVYGYFRVDETVKASVETSLNAEVVHKYNDVVKVNTTSGVLEFKNSELFNITYDNDVIDSVNIFNHRKDFTQYIKHTLREEGFEKLCKSVRSNMDAYYFVESITEDLELIRTAVEKELNTDKLRKDLDLSSELDINDYFAYEEPDNSAVEEEYKDIGALQDWTVKYDNSLTFSWKDIEGAVTYDNGLKIDSTIYKTLAEKVADKYDTLGEIRSIKTPNGKAWVSGGTYGWKVDIDAEEEYLEKSIHEREQVEDRTPCFTQKAFSKKYGENDIGKNYVLVDISDQHVWVYKNGKVVKDSDCVTGTLGVHDTPLGVYSVMEVLPKGKVLRGDDYATPVKKWIRLTNSGIGLHDASWRSYFGGSIYKSSGSHGCINLPYEFANYLCKYVKTGMPVVVIA